MEKITERQHVEAGDVVTIGKSRAVHWDVLEVFPSIIKGYAIAHLNSGMSRRNRFEPVHKLKIYRKGEK